MNLSTGRTFRAGGGSRVPGAPASDGMMGEVAVAVTAGGALVDADVPADAILETVAAAMAGAG